MEEKHFKVCEKCQKGIKIGNNITLPEFDEESQWPYEAPCLLCGNKETVALVRVNKRGIIFKTPWRIVGLTRLE
jgi:hypothetical protein